VQEEPTDPVDSGLVFPLDSASTRPGPSLALRTSVLADADETVMRVRTGFLKNAVTQVRELVAHGDIQDALNASYEVRRYFEWIKKDLSPAARGVFLEEIQTLPTRIENLR
jgi:hypothetical protein